MAIFVEAVVSVCFWSLVVFVGDVDIEVNVFVAAEVGVVTEFAADALISVVVIPFVN